MADEERAVRAASKAAAVTAMGWEEAAQVADKAPVV